ARPWQYSSTVVRLADGVASLSSMSFECVTGSIISWKHSTGNQASFQLQAQHQDIDSRTDAQQRDLIPASVVTLFSTNRQRHRQCSGSRVSEPRVSGKINRGTEAEFVEH